MASIVGYWGIFVLLRSTPPMTSPTRRRLEAPCHSPSHLPRPQHDTSLVLMQMPRRPPSERSSTVPRRCSTVSRRRSTVSRRRSTVPRRRSAVPRRHSSIARHPLHPTNTLVNLERIDSPVRVPEGGGVVRDERVTGGGLGGALRGRAPDGAGPVAAEGRVEDELQAGEVGGDVAGPREEGDGAAPAGRVGLAGGDVCRDGGAGEEVDLDRGRGPFGGVDAAVSRWMLRLGAGISFAR